LRRNLGSAMGAALCKRLPLDVKRENHPAYCKNKLKRLVAGDPVRRAIHRMLSFPDTLELLEECCIQLHSLAAGGACCSPPAASSLFSDAAATHTASP
jgi:hypothetical protein